VLAASEKQLSQEESEALKDAAESNKIWEKWLNSRFLCIPRWQGKTPTDSTFFDVIPKQGSLAMENPGEFLSRSPEIWDKKRGFHWKTTTASPGDNHADRNAEGPSAAATPKQVGSQKGVRKQRTRAKEQEAGEAEGQEAVEQADKNPVYKRRKGKQSANPKSPTAQTARPQGGSSTILPGAGGGPETGGRTVRRSPRAARGCLSDREAVVESTQLQQPDKSQEQVRFGSRLMIEPSRIQLNILDKLYPRTRDVPTFQDSCKLRAV
jgi:hypothetical protein